MRTRTIYNADKKIDKLSVWPLSSADAMRRRRQRDRFHAELCRRLDERDTLVRRFDECDELRWELATARAFISSVVDAPKDYPAEASA